MLTNHGEEENVIESEEQVPVFLRLRTVTWTEAVLQLGLHRRGNNLGLHVNLSFKFINRPGLIICKISV